MKLLLIRKFYKLKSKLFSFKLEFLSSAFLLNGFVLINPDEKKWMGLITFFAFLSKIMEMVAIASVMPVVALIIDPTLLYKSKNIGAIYDVVGEFVTVSQFVPFLTLVSAGLLIFSGVLEFIILAFLTKLVGRCEGRLAVDLMKKLLSAPERWFHDRNTSELIRVFNTDINAWAFLFVRNFMVILLQGMTILGGVLVLLFMTSTFAFIALSITAFMALLLMRLTRPRAIKWSRSLKDAQTTTTLKARDLLEGRRDLRFAISSSYLQEKFSGAYWNKVVSLGKQTTWTNLPSRILLTLGQMLILFTALTIWAISSEPSKIAGEMAVVFIVLSKILPALNQLVASISGLMASQPWIDGLWRLINSLSSAKELSYLSPKKFKGNIFLEAPRKWTLLRLERVSFDYGAGQGAIFKDFDVSIKCGSYVGIVGSSGSGKSTLIDILTGTLQPSTGKVTIDGLSLSDIRLQSWRDQIGFVGQSTYFIDGSVIDNVAFGVPENEVDIKKIWSSLSLAGIDSLIRKLPSGLNTPIGEGSQMLSGGQRQRLAIARALYKQPSVLLLDEATSALDFETERQFLESLKKLKGEITIVMVSHKQSALVDVEVIIDLSGGKEDCCDPNIRYKLV